MLFPYYFVLRCTYHVVNLSHQTCSDDSRFGQKYDNNKKQDAETMKVAIVLSMLQEMGINDKTSDDVLM